MTKHEWKAGEEYLVDHTEEGQFLKCKIIGTHSSGDIVYEVIEGRYSGTVDVGIDSQFKPIKTDEQIERERLFDLAFKAACVSNLTPMEYQNGVNHAIDHLIKAGMLVDHAKQVKPLSLEIFAEIKLGSATIQVEYDYLKRNGYIIGADDG